MLEFSLNLYELLRFTEVHSLLKFLPFKVRLQGCGKDIRYIKFYGKKLFAVNFTNAILL